MYNKLVSIIIPTYKRTKPLERAIKSAQDQTYSNIEIIIVNDNGSDEFTEYVLKLYAKLSLEDSRIKLVNYEGNKNGAYARNAGVAASLGDYIAFLDDDDFFYPKKISTQVEYLISNLDRFNAVYCKLYKANGRMVKNYHEGDLSKYILKQESVVPTPTLMFTRSAFLEIGGFDINLLRHQDYDLMLRFFEKFKIGFVNEFLAEQGENDGENMIYGKKLEETKEYFLNKFAIHINRLSKKEASEVYVINYFNMALANLKKGLLSYSVKHLFKSFCHSPTIFVNHFIAFVGFRFK